jgi:hypothetical protein
LGAVYRASAAGSHVLHYDDEVNEQFAPVDVMRESVHIADSAISDDII